MALSFPGHKCQHYQDPGHSSNSRSDFIEALRAALKTTLEAAVGASGVVEIIFGEPYGVAAPGHARAAGEWLMTPSPANPHDVMPCSPLAPSVGTPAVP